MNEIGKINSAQDNVEHLIQRINSRIENLKVQFTLFFSGEIKLPPEKEREDIEKMVRSILSAEQKSPRTSLLIQNLASSFSLYNNIWLKKLNEIECGIAPKKMKTAHMEEQKLHTKQPQKEEELININLNNENSFEKFYAKCKEIIPNKNSSHKDKIINSLKIQLISKNIIDAKVSISINKGKLKIRFKKK